MWLSAVTVEIEKSERVFWRIQEISRTRKLKIQFFPKTKFLLYSLYIRNIAHRQLVRGTSEQSSRLLPGITLFGQQELRIRKDDHTGSYYLRY